MFCKACGNQIDNGCKYCSKCGAVVNDNNMSSMINNNYRNNFSVNSQVNNSNNVSQKKSKSNFIIIGVVVGVLLIVIIGSVQINNWYKDFTEEINNIWNDDNNNTNNNSSNSNNENNYLDNNDDFVANNIKEYSELGYMKYSVPDCWSYDNQTSASYQYKNSVFVYRDNVSMLLAKAGSLLGDDDELERYNYFKDQIIKSYGSIRIEETKYFNNKKWYVFTTNQYKNPYNGAYFYNNIYFTFSNSANSIYYFEVYIDNNVADKNYIEDSIEYIVNSTELYKVYD